MNCKACHSLLSYHSDGITCRNCGYKYSKEEKFFCDLCGCEVEESRKAESLCIFCLYEVTKGLR